MRSKILVVDDEPDVAKAWAKALKIVGYDVVQAGDAQSALELSRANPLDLVILDFMMPSMSGIELLNEIRKDHPVIRSIIVSGKLDPNVDEDNLLSEIRTNIEVDRYLHKPLDNSSLKNAVSELLLAKQDADWVSLAERKLSAAAKKANVRAAEKNLKHRKK